MRKIALLLAFIITTLTVPGLASNVDFIVIPSLCGPGQPILYFDYRYIYDHWKPLHDGMTMYAGHNEVEQQYMDWLVENVGYLMYKHSSAYVYISDPFTPQTDVDTARVIRTQHNINITDELLQNLQRDFGQRAYGILRRGPNFYLLYPDYTNEWPLHLLEAY